ncbi:hypothetical protein B0H10DRAFT_2032254 [Mycena sp. CBHHK59/15]|nr:hypothetical protein B0H10DRAFT_2032254 [Mycena sp. CBHHK59/15]
MDDAWQSQDIAPSGISIPTGDAPAPADGGDAPWSANGHDNADRERDGGRDRENGNGRRGRSRSRSPGPARDGERGHNPGNNLHVSSLSHKVDTRDLEAAFAKIGRVKKASVMYDPHTRESRGFGFVTMETGEEADAAITALNATELMGKVMNVEKARRGRARTPTPGRYYGPPKRGDSECLSIFRFLVALVLFPLPFLLILPSVLIAVFGTPAPIPGYIWGRRAGRDDCTALAHSAIPPYR